jgi:hypothetical protein
LDQAIVSGVFTAQPIVPTDWREDNALHAAKTLELQAPVLFPVLLASAVSSPMTLMSSTQELDELEVEGREE